MAWPRSSLFRYEDLHGHAPRALRAAAQVQALQIAHVAGQVELVELALAQHVAIVDIERLRAAALEIGGDPAAAGVALQRLEGDGIGALAAPAGEGGLAVVAALEVFAADHLPIVDRVAAPVEHARPAALPVRTALPVA